MTARPPRMPSTAAFTDDRRDARVFRRGLLTAGAILGVAPFLHAVAPRCLPASVHALTAVWEATMLAWLASLVEEQLVSRIRRHSNTSAE